MAEPNDRPRSEPTATSGARPAKEPINWRRYTIVLVIGLAAAVAAYLFAVTVVPRWWAQRVADQVDGKMGAGIGWGLFYGIVFTFVPLLVARQAVRDFSWRTRGILIALAVVLAAPNWLTLGIVAGNGRTAHAGERILDVEGPGFRAATLVGVIGAAVVALGVFGVLALGRRDRRELKQLRGRRGGKPPKTSR